MSVEESLFVYLLGIAVFGAAFIWFLLRVRDKKQEEASEISIEDVRRNSLALKNTDFLYAYEKDFSLNQVGYIIRDSKNDDIAKVFLGTGLKRAAYAVIVVDNQEYECVSLFTWNGTHGVLQKESSNTAICEVITKRFKRPCYVFPDGSEYIKRFNPLSEEHTIINKKNNQVAMKIFPYSKGLLEKGKILLCHDDLPKPVQLFMMID